MNRFGKGKRILALLVAAALILGQAVPSRASQNSESTGKEEVVYVRLSSEGEVLNTYVVNIFPGGDVTDYGDYTSVKILNTTDPITQTGDEISFSTNAEKVYYQGELEGAQIPWDIMLHYELDGEEVSPENLAGADGDLCITLSISRNESCDGTFYDDYALQVTFTLDTDLCDSIEAPDATIANVGSSKQLTYTILPGQGIDTVICTRVHDFVMDAAAINGIRMNLSLSVDDEELLEQITDLYDAIEEIDDGTGDVQEGIAAAKDSVEEDLLSGAQEMADGASDLADGAGDLADGGRKLSDGAQSLADGADALDAGISSLNDGIAQIQSGLDALGAQSGSLTEGSSEVLSALAQIQAALSDVSESAGQLEELVNASSAIRQGIEDLSSGASALQKSASFTAYKLVMKQNGLDIDELTAGNEQAASSIRELLDTVEAYESQLSAILGMFNINVDIDACKAMGEQIILLLEGNTAAIGGMESYLNALYSGAAQLSDGAASLAENYEMFDAGIGSLAEELTVMLYQMSALQSAVSALVAEYGKLDDGIAAYTDGVAQVAAGYAQLADGAKEAAQGSALLLDGSTSLSDGTKDLLDGILTLYDATGSFRDGTGELTDGVQELLDGLQKLCDGSTELKDGTGELRSRTDGMDQDLKDQIQEILDGFTGGDGEVTSFVSEKNEKVSSVQFVIQTEAIRLPEAESVQEAEETFTFWQRLLNLFKG